MPGDHFARPDLRASDDPHASSSQPADHTSGIARRKQQVTNSHDQGIAVLSSFRTAVRLPILFGLERQCAEEWARHPAALWRGRRRRRPVGDAGRCGLHLSLFRAFGARWRTGRQIRQDDRRAPAEIRGLLCGRRLLHAFDPVAFCGARAVRRDRRTVRPGEIRDPSRSAIGFRTLHRQRSRRRRDLPGDPDRHHRRRTAGRRRFAYGMDLPCSGRAVGAVLGVRVPYPRDPALRARPADHSQPLDLHRSPLEDALRRAAPLGRHGDRILVLDGRRDRAVAAARAGQGRHRRHRRRRDSLPRRVRNRYCRGFAVCRAAQPCAAESRAGADRRDRDGHRRPRSGLGHWKYGERHGRNRRRIHHLLCRCPDARRLLPVRGWRRLVRGAVLCRRAGMVCAVGTGPRDRCRQRAAGCLHGGRLAACRGLAGGWRSGCLDILRPCDRKLWLGLVRTQQMGPRRRARLRGAAVSCAVPRRGSRHGRTM